MVARKMPMEVVANRCNAVPARNSAIEAILIPI